MSPLLAAVWWPEQSHIELECNGKLYQIFHGEVERSAPIQKRVERAAASADKHFLRFYLPIQKEMAAELQERLDQNTLPIAIDYCSGSVGRLINRYSEVQVSFWESRTPYLLSCALFERADRVEYIGEKVRSATREDVQNRNFFYKEIAPLAAFAATAALAITYSRLTAPYSE